MAAYIAGSVARRHLQNRLPFACNNMFGRLPIDLGQSALIGITLYRVIAPGAGEGLSFVAFTVLGMRSPAAQVHVRAALGTDQHVVCAKRSLWLLFPPHDAARRIGVPGQLSRRR